MRLGIQGINNPSKITFMGIELSKFSIAGTQVVGDSITAGPISGTVVNTSAGLQLDGSLAAFTCTPSSTLIHAFKFYSIGSNTKWEPFIKTNNKTTYPDGTYINSLSDINFTVTFYSDGSSYTGSSGEIEAIAYNGYWYYKPCTNNSLQADRPSTAMNVEYSTMSNSTATLGNSNVRTYIGTREILDYAYDTKNGSGILAGKSFSNSYANASLGSLYRCVLSNKGDYDEQIADGTGSLTSRTITISSGVVNPSWYSHNNVVAYLISGPSLSHNDYARIWHTSGLYRQTAILTNGTQVTDLYIPDVYLATNPNTNAWYIIYRVSLASYDISEVRSINIAPVSSTRQWIQTTHYWEA